VVTGATSGIGLSIAEQLVESGANLIGIGRSLERCQDTENRLRAITPTAQVDYLVADLSLQSEVLKAAEGVCTILREHGKKTLDGLVNNAGTFTYWLALTPEGFETQWAVNHLAPFRLTLELLPLLQAAPSARVVTVSSDSHYAARLKWNDIQLRRCYNGLRAYEQTKLANVLFTAEFNRRLGLQSSVRAFAADPGLVKTDIGRKGTPGVVRWIWGLRSSGGITPAESARGIVFLLTEPSIQDANAIYWKHGKPKPSSRYSLDCEAARRLWDISETMCAL
ncbi:MAG: SDR family NAD(P)-dependent oxidoreductase, partial [Anaerolineaceae bacterium]|nr:SDR family NAD(P)-dependent oxidoreductase [Anaerolineaceae bacterium]